jgi:azurin
MIRFALGADPAENRHPMSKYLSLICGLAALAVTGCGQKEAATQAADAPPGPRTIEITAGDTMKYSLTAFEAKPGEEIKVVLTNNGSQPIEVMGHNWVLLKPGTDVAAYDAAAISAKDTGYIPAALADSVVAHIELVGPRKSGEVDFKVPMTPGDYPFLCTFPAHYQIGMKGILTVK